MFCCSSLKFLTNGISHQQEHAFIQCGDKRQFLDVAQSLCRVTHFLGKVILKVLRRFYSFKDKCDVLSWSIIEVTGMVLVSPYPKRSCAQCLNPQGQQFLVFYLEKQKPAVSHLGQHNWLKGKFQRSYKKAPRTKSVKMVANTWSMSKVNCISHYIAWTTGKRRFHRFFCLQVFLPSEDMVLIVCIRADMFLVVPVLVHLALLISPVLFRENFLGSHKVM